MNRIAALETLVNQFDLNHHPFYTAWSNGTLPVAKLRRYASEYAEFIGSVADGWEQTNETSYADEERVHHQLWLRFAESLNASDEPGLPHSTALVATASHLFHTSPENLGALYAFESQQSRTARTKLEGLQTHYTNLVDEAGQEYFRLHIDNASEIELLGDRLNQLSDDDYARAHTACHLLCTTMWHALNGYWFVATEKQAA
jgi:pyrroloquinoline quinone (PQQ) biosynthesis protein C